VVGVDPGVVQQQATPLQPHPRLPPGTRIVRPADGGPEIKLLPVYKFYIDDTLLRTRKPTAWSEQVQQASLYSIYGADAHTPQVKISLTTRNDGKGSKVSLNAYRRGTTLPLGRAKCSENKCIVESDFAYGCKMNAHLPSLDDSGAVSEVEWRVLCARTPKAPGEEHGKAFTPQITVGKEATVIQLNLPDKDVTAVLTQPPPGFEHARGKRLLKITIGSLFHAEDHRDVGRVQFLSWYLAVITNALSVRLLWQPPSRL